MVNLYVYENGSVTYRFTDGKLFKSLEVFKKEYKNHFKRDPKIKKENKCQGKI